MRTVLSIAAVFLCASPAVVVVLGSFPEREVITEPKRKTIPGGPGQKPFDVTRHTIPLSEIRGGGPGRDDIPALASPNFLTADKVGGLLHDSDRVIGVYLNGEAKAYPIRILNWHELVNDTVGGRPVLVTW
jgi:hypothetical protein